MVLVHLGSTIAILLWSCITFGNSGTASPSGFPSQYVNTINIYNHNNDASSPTDIDPLDGIHQATRHRTQYQERDLSFMNFSGNWNVVYHNLEVISSSSAAAQSLGNFFDKVQDIIQNEITAFETRYLSFQSGAIQYSISCASQVIPREVVVEITSFMEIWGRMERMGLPSFSTMVFYSMYYATKGVVVILVSLQLLVAAVRPDEMPNNQIVTGGKRNVEEYNERQLGSTW